MGAEAQNTRDSGLHRFCIAPMMDWGDSENIFVIRRGYDMAGNVAHQNGALERLCGICWLRTGDPVCRCSKGQAASSG